MPCGSPLDSEPIVVQGSGSTPVDPGLITLTNVIYGLHACSILIGVLGSAFIVGAFLFGIPSIIAVIINYVKRPDVRGTFLDTHFRWQIRTFWFAMLWAAIGGLILLTIILFFLGLAVLAATGLWVIYRVVRGWLALNERKPLPV
jgi:uncharacterized membrane protein